MTRQRKRSTAHPTTHTTDDTAYKRLFAEPRIVRDLLLRFVMPGWTARLDFSTLQALPTEHIGDNLKTRRKDIVWRVRFLADRAVSAPEPDGVNDDGDARPLSDAPTGDWLYLVVMIEFQSRDDHFMALRMSEYNAMLYRHLSRLPEHARSGQVPPILPIVIYNGESEWKAADSVIALIPSVPEPHLRPWLPTHRTYLLIDEVRLARQFGPALPDNLAELFMRIEASPDGESMPRLIRHLVTLLASPAADSLRLAFTAWIRHTLARGLGKDDNQLARTLDHLELDEMPTVFENTMKRLYEQKRQEGHKQGHLEGHKQGHQEGHRQGHQERGADLLIRQLGVRFGELPAGIVERIRTGAAEDHDRWAERLLSAPTLDAVFAGEPPSTH